MSNAVLLQTIGIGAGALVLGLLLGLLINRGRFRRLDDTWRGRTEELGSKLALGRLQILDLESRLAAPTEALSPKIEPLPEIEPLPPSMYRMAPQASTRPRWVATPPEETPDSAPSRA